MKYGNDLKLSELPFDKPNIEDAPLNCKAVLTLYQSLQAFGGGLGIHTRSAAAWAGCLSEESQKMVAFTMKAHKDLAKYHDALKNSFATKAEHMIEQVKDAVEVFTDDMSIKDCAATNKIMKSLTSLKDAFVLKMTALGFKGGSK